MGSFFAIASSAHHRQRRRQPPPLRASSSSDVDDDREEDGKLQQSTGGCWGVLGEEKEHAEADPLASRLEAAPGAAPGATGKKI